MSLKYSHLTASFLAILLGLGALGVGTVYAQSLERRYVHALAPLMLVQSTAGSALQQTALQQPDLLVVYGSSEMLDGNTPDRAFLFFQNYPTGFQVYEVARLGATSLDMAQALAAVGPDLRGKKVVLSFTPSMFNAREVGAYSYAADFSPLHADGLIFNSSLSLETRQIAAERMGQYPGTLEHDSILQFAVAELACKCWTGSLLYALDFPLGLVHTGILRMQDSWEVLTYIWSHPSLNWKVARQPAQIDWVKRIAQAARVEGRRSSNNPYGFENGSWDKSYALMLARPKPPGSADAEFLRRLAWTKEWVDFDLALRVLKELGAQPLILSRPMDGTIWNAVGVSWQARREYYQRLQREVAAYGFPLVDFSNHDGDPYFSYDFGSHTSPEGWVYIDQTLDAFFHRSIH